MKLLRNLAAIAAAVSLAGQASAVPVNVTVDAAGNLLNTTGIANSAQYEALHGLSPSNNNPDRNLAFLQALLGNYNGAIDPDLPAAVGPVALDQGSLGGGNSFNAPAGYDYVVFHFGAGPAGGGRVSAGGWWQAFYLGGDAASFDLPTVNGENVGGYSSARFYNPGRRVPDGGATLALFGIGLAALGLLRGRILRS